MAQNDAAVYTLRWNEVFQQLEGAYNTAWVALPLGGAGVSSLNSLTGAVTLSAGSNVTLTPSGNNITIASSGTTTPNFIAEGGAINGDSTNTTAFVRCSGKVTITPSSNTATIIVMATVSIQVISNTGSPSEYYLTIFRDTTAADHGVISDGTNVSLDSRGLSSAFQSSSNGADMSLVVSIPIIVTDVPGTGAHTYTVGFRTNVSGQTQAEAGNLNSIIAFEVH